MMRMTLVTCTPRSAHGPCWARALSFGRDAPATMVSAVAQPNMNQTCQSACSGPCPASCSRRWPAAGNLPMMAWRTACVTAKDTTRPTMSSSRCSTAWFRASCFTSLRHMNHVNAETPAMKVKTKMQKPNEAAGSHCFGGNSLAVRWDWVLARMPAKAMKCAPTLQKVVMVRRSSRQRYAMASAMPYSTRHCKSAKNSAASGKACLMSKVSRNCAKVLNQRTARKMDTNVSSILKVRVAINQSLIAMNITIGTITTVAIRPTATECAPSLEVPWPWPWSWACSSECPWPSLLCAWASSAWPPCSWPCPWSSSAWPPCPWPCP
mmetsp:Transcript_78407/g.189964  ORF Transcript_78407/g.189964 Transcript_78407/m.189964 type:complete len:322 (-) Transcript_78407:299-1264(-)